ncbi:MAG: YfhO family protein, partial [bacterium]|nr:YfhO family protein [bacterium]
PIMSFKCLNCQAKILDYRENKVKIETENEADGFLVLTDGYYPTWHVVVDGKEEKIYKTNYNFRAVIVPSGKHQLEFYISLF